MLVHLDKATYPQLLHIASVELGLDVPKNATAAGIREVIRASGNINKTFEIEDRAVLASTSRPRTAEDDYTHVKLTIQVQDTHDGTEMVKLAHNGVPILVPRGEPVILKRDFFRVLEDAVETVFPETPNPTSADDPALGLGYERKRVSYIVHEYIKNADAA